MAERDALRPRQMFAGRLMIVGCFILISVVIGGAIAAYLSLRATELTAPLILALPNCTDGVYKARSTTADVLDRAANDVQRTACEGSKGLQGVAVLSRNILTLQLHNANYFPLTTVQVRTVLRPASATSFERMYRLEGNVAPLADGELRIATNLDANALKSFSPVLTWVWFDNKIDPADGVKLPNNK